MDGHSNHKSYKLEILMQFSKKILVLILIQLKRILNDDDEAASADI